MRRLGAICLALVFGAAALASGADAGGDPYLVRAIFDSGGFVVPGEEVRIAGAKVGTIADVDVTGTSEAAHEGGDPEPGKAVVVLEIDDPGFQDFRADASCLIRPQSLIGEKFVECEPTQPRAPGAEPPPPLAAIPGGEPGDGQRFLGLERNGKSVDLDLFNNIMREPYPDRFRLILNDLGAGLAARGEDLAEIVERSNPALRETNEVLAVLARQNRSLARLARDGDRVLAPLARERVSLSGFVNEAETAAAATAERRSELELGLSRLPGALRELRLTMDDFRDLAASATPVFDDLGAAAPALTVATEKLGPFAEQGTTAIETLGEAAVEAEPPLLASRPILRRIRTLARSGKPAARKLAKLLRSLRKTDGFALLAELIFNASGSINGFDSHGHFLRALLPANNCVDYELIPEGDCDANFNRAGTSAAASTAGPRSGARPSASPTAGNLRDARTLLDALIGEEDGR